MMRYVTYAECVELHHILMLDRGQQAVLVAREKLESALARPQASAFGEDLFPDIATKAAALLQGIAIAHPFMDGNKRAAASAALAFIELNAGTTDVSISAFYDLTIAVASGELREVDEIAVRLRKLFSLPE